MTNSAGVLDTICCSVAARPLPNPPPQAGEGARLVSARSCGELAMKFTLSWLKEHLDTDAPLDDDRRQAHHDRARGREASRTRRKLLAPFTIARVIEAEAASQCRPAARLHGRYRRRRAGAGGVRRAQCAHRHERRVRAARRLHSRARTSRSASATSAASRAAACWSPDAELQISDDHDGIIDLPADAPVGASLRRMGRARRSGDRDQPHAQPAGLHRRRRHRARSRRRRHGHVHRAHADQAGEGRVPLPGHGDARLRRDAVALPGLRAAAGARRQERPVAGLAAEAAHGDRASARSTRWSTSPTSSPTTAAGRCMCSTPPR